MVADYKRQYAGYKKKGGTRSYGSWIKWKGYCAGILGDIMYAKPEDLNKWASQIHSLIGSGVDIQKQLAKLGE